ncbi:MAG: carbon storage regulator [Bradymonadaceae bacterium]
MGITFTRKVGQEIVIGGNIVIEVKLIRKNQVRIEVRAPRSIQVDRREVVIAREEEGNGC